jgi:hypothetical protein
VSSVQGEYFLAFRSDVEKLPMWWVFWCRGWGIVGVSYCG